MLAIGPVKVMERYIYSVSVENLAFTVFMPSSGNVSVVRPLKGMFEKIPGESLRILLTEFAFCLNPPCHG